MKRYTPLIWAVLLWSVLILRFGYRFGSGDQVELMPYVKFLQNQTLYSSDFFIKNLNASVPNERTFIAHALLPFANHLEITALVLHFLATVMLVLGLVRLAHTWIRNELMAWLSVAIALIVLNDFSLGNVELYSECFQASYLADAISVWALVCFLSNKRVEAVLLMLAATFVHPLAGLILAVVLFFIWVADFVQSRIAFARLVCLASIYAFIAGPYIISILLAKYSATDTSITNTEYFNILIRFRHPHHFVFASFPVVKSAVFFVLAMVAGVYFRKYNRTVFLFVLYSLIACMLYGIAVDVFQNAHIVNFQFYRITPWVKFFGVVALMALVSNSFSLPKQKASMKLALPSLLLLLVVITVFKFHAQLPYKVPFQLPGFKKESVIEICDKIKDVTPANAVFIQPFEVTELKYYAQRSSYVEFKANVKHRAALHEWYRRIREVYGIAADAKITGFSLQQKADVFYCAMQPQIIQQLKKEGVTHMLTYSSCSPLPCKVILQNEDYVVYQL